MMRGSQHRLRLNDTVRDDGNIHGRRMPRLAVLMFVFAMLASGALKSQPASAAAGCCYRTTTPLNLRAEPSLSAQVLLIMPAEVVVVDAGSSANGFVKVEYNGTTGWAYGDYLASTNPDLA